jgi:predicted ATP-grasp superfamily ATP-dependent carboligase
MKNGKSEYLGGYTPFENYNEMVKSLSIYLNRIKELKIEGYFGIDFLKKHDNTFFFIEINPRLTTSYIGLREIIDHNCAELILNSKLGILNKAEINIKNFSYFTRIDLYYDSNEHRKEFSETLMPKLINAMPEFVTPPITLNGSNFYSCFIATKTKDLRSSKIRLNEIIQSLKNFKFNVIKPIETESK